MQLLNEGDNMKKAFLLCITLLTLFTAPILAEETVEKGFCREEIKKFCGEMKGKERKACIAEKQDLLNPKCHPSNNKKSVKNTEKKKIQKAQAKGKRKKEKL